MSITKVGSSYNFIYNTKTGKLSTKDGSKNEFVDFCNGDVKGEDTETLNHFDEHTRYQFTRMLFAYGTGMTGQNPFANDEKVEITADIDSATHTSFYVNGQKAFTAIIQMFTKVIWAALSKPRIISTKRALHGLAKMPLPARIRTSAEMQYLRIPPWQGTPPMSETPRLSLTMP